MRYYDSINKYINKEGKQILSENYEYSLPFPDDSRRNLRADCENCFGLCCVALYFSASEGFQSTKTRVSLASTCNQTFVVVYTLA